MLQKYATKYRWFLLGREVSMYFWETFRVKTRVFVELCQLHECHMDTSNGSIHYTVELVLESNVVHRKITFK